MLIEHATNKHSKNFEDCFNAEDGVVKISLNTARQKVKNLEANPAVTAFILDTADPNRYLEIRGDATLTPDRRTLHAGSPVVQGVKFVANKWLRERTYG